MFSSVFSSRIKNFALVMKDPRTILIERVRGFTLKEWLVKRIQKSHRCTGYLRDLVKKSHPEKSRIRNSNYKTDFS